MSQPLQKPAGWLIIALVGALLLGGAYLGSRRASCQAMENPQSAPQPPLPTSEELAGVEQISRVFNKVAEAVRASVVHIGTRKKGKSRDWESLHKFFKDDKLQPFFRFEFPDQPRPQIGLGSGTVYDSDGYILTNYHVVKDADEITITLQDGSEYEPEWVRTDPPTDLAVIKIDAKGLPALQFGDSDKINVGDWVLAVGNPFGLDSTVTQGIISYRSRGVMQAGTNYSSYIQTDAAINPGNSGGPLVNLQGKVIGVNTFIITRTATYAGLGFAIPANTAKFVATQLKTSEKVVRSYLGVQIRDLTIGMAKTFDYDSTDGVLVEEVKPDTPADKGGMKAGDIIIELAGEKIRQVYQLQTMVAETKPGTKVKIVVWRDGAKKELTIKLEKMPEGFFEEQFSARPDRGGRRGQHEIESLGMTVSTLTDELAEKYDHEDRQGVVVISVDPDGEAFRRGLREGDLITYVQREKVTSAPQFKRLLKKYADQEGVRLRVRSSGGGSRFVYVPMR